MHGDRSHHTIKLSIVHIDTSKAVRVKSLGTSNDPARAQRGTTCVLEAGAGEYGAILWKASLLPGPSWLLRHVEQAF
jgi:hypothetical protein